MVGLLPCAPRRWWTADVFERFPQLWSALSASCAFTPRWRTNIAPLAPSRRGGAAPPGGPDETKLRRVLGYLLDEAEFLGPYGVRALSRYHAGHPYVVSVQGQEYRVEYQPAESTSGLFGGNSNWRGPVWVPLNALLIRSLLQLYSLLRGRLHRGVPHRLGPDADPLRGGPGADPAPGGHLRPRRRRPAPRLRGGRDVPERPPLARPPPLLRVLPRGQRGRAGGQSPDRLDGRGGPSDPALRFRHGGGRAAEGDPGGGGPLPPAGPGPAGPSRGPPAPGGP